MKFILRVREQRIGDQAITTLWLMQRHTEARSGLMHGDLRPEQAEAVIALLEGKGVKIERDAPRALPADSELPHGTAADAIAATESQGVMFCPAPLTPSETMKALTISQPFASLIANGEKFVENRRWETLYRGPLAIHAGKGTQYLDKQELAEYPTGCVVAVADLVACLHIESIRSGRGFLGNTRSCGNLSLEQIRDNEHTEGPFCWILGNVRKLATPVPWVGCLGTWNVPDELLRLVEEQL